MENGYSLSDIAAVNDGFGGGNAWSMIILFALIFGWGGMNRNGDYGQYATAASQQDILFSSKFSALDNKIDRIGNGIADATFALNNSIKDGNNMVAGTVISESRSIQDKLCALNTAIHAEGEATRTMMYQNKIEALQQKVSSLELSQAMCGVVRYPNQMAYNAGTSPFCNCNNGCGCGNI